MAAACSDSSALPRLFRPEEIADALGCSAWWVKDRASRGRIPFTRVGRSYRFTAEHLAEIIRLYEVRPAIAPEPVAPSVRTVPSRTAAPSARLRARRPRRARQDDFDTTA
ncbi:MULTISPECIES: helix-turn-helix domain-containing protein [unclassified Streptomyces]|uniref:helix-turn-helix domain-containing protein n=1 Tax=Streptomyces TaxID=1883 RepID=UPI001FAEBA75|nr:MULTISPECIES: helix-turn-helix domain-containing protein [unclassified Streptomyces]MCJ0868430.1 helix-turn-helix domain-containing protein [Streptomyces sp. AP-93]MCY0951282.1 helix-turn-helix domain-containing protein [Streptomyces sp. H27-S2]